MLGGTMGEGRGGSGCYFIFMSWLLGAFDFLCIQ